MKTKEQAVTIGEDELVVKHPFKGPEKFGMKIIAGESIGAMKVRMCEELAAGQLHAGIRVPKVLDDEQMMLIHDSRTMLDNYTVDDYELHAGETIVVEYTKPMCVRACVRECVRMLTSQFFVTRGRVPNRCFLACVCVRVRKRRRCCG